MSVEIQSLMERLSRLKTIDKVVDLSRSNIQLEIMFLLSSRGELTAHDMARLMGQRRKAVTDALRKLKFKDVVEEVEVEGERLYRLSPFGEKCLAALLEATGLKSIALQRQELYKFEGLESTVKNMTMSYYVFDCLVAMGLAGGKVDVQRLAEIVNLSPQRLQAYLDVFAGDANPRLFKKYVVPTRFSSFLQKLNIGCRRSKTMYALTEEGSRLFLRSPQYAKLKSSRLYRILSALTKARHPKELWQTLSLIMYLGVSVTAVAALISPVALIASLIFFNALGILIVLSRLKKSF